MFCITGTITLNVSAVSIDKVESKFSYTDSYGVWTYEYGNDDNSYIITGYSGNSSYIRIPDTIKNVPVVAIYGAVFSGLDTLESVSIPYGITYIGDGAFSNCFNLNYISIPSSVTTTRN